MFLLWLLALLDLSAVALMLLFHYSIVPWRVVFPFAMYLILKGVAFRDVSSVFDMIAGIYIAGMVLFGFHTFLVYLFAAYLVEKAVFSFF